MTSVAAAASSPWRAASAPSAQMSTSTRAMDTSSAAGEPIATSAPAPLIQALDVASVHRICSGQVILDLATAVKELVENSLDAGATSIVVSLVGQGAVSLEVADNGGGVTADCRASLALKHWTSKLRSFGDLASVASFGFRGEALSSLCALGDLAVVTRCEGESTATSLTYNNEGVLAQQRPASRTVGTTVTLTRLFASLPVRHKVFLKSLKKEYGKMLNVVQSYAMVCRGTRIHVYNTPVREGANGAPATNGSRALVLSTQGSNDVRELIANVFGTKQAAALQEVDFTLRSNQNFTLNTNYPLPAVGAAAAAAASTGSIAAASTAAAAAAADPTDGAPSSREPLPMRLCGFVSRVEAKCGRSAADRQYLYVNTRPVDLPRIARVVNDAYRACNAQTSFPVFVLNLLLPAGSFDVNLTPNKRETMLHDEHAIIGLIKEYFQTMFEPSMYTYKVKSLSDFGITSAKTSSAQEGSDSTHSHSQPHPSEGDDGSPSLSQQLHSFDSDMDSPSLQISTQSPSQPLAGGFLSPELKGQSPADSPSSLLLESKRAPSTPYQSLSRSVATPPSASSAASPLHSAQSLPNNKRSTSAAPVDSESRPAYGHALVPPSGRALPRPLSHVLQSLPTARSPAAYAAALQPLTAPPLARHHSTPADTATSASPSVLQRSTNSFLNSFMRRGSSAVTVENDQTTADGPPLHPAANLAHSADRAAKRMRTDDTSDSSPNDDLESTLRPGLSRQATQLLPAADVSPDSALDPLFDGAGSSPAPAGDPSLALFDDTDIGVEYRASDAQRLVDVDLDALQRFYSAGTSLDYGAAADAHAASLLDRAEAILSPSASDAPSVSAATLLGASAVGSGVTAAGAAAAASSRVLSESSLQRVIEKADFLAMEIVGQFNLGFIIAKMNNDLFIIDQHATDEKYRFEYLERTTVINSQPLLNPLPLDCTPAMQITLREHAHVFRLNGFDIHVPEEEGEADHDADDGGMGDEQANENGGGGDGVDTQNARRMAAARRRVCVKTLPFSKSLTFGAGDIYELCALLDEHPGASMVRLPKVTTMLASRACRSAVMIGTSLSKARMTTIVRHMAEMIHPWACPHGRRVMSHLVDLRQFASLSPSSPVPVLPTAHAVASPAPTPSTSSCCAH